MRGLLKFLGIIGFIWGLFLVRSAIIKNGIEGESLQFVKDTVGTVTLNWNRAELDRHADPTLQSQVAATGNPHALDFAFFAKLGARTSDLACDLGDYTTHKNETQNYIAANYSCAASFEKGAASVEIGVVRDKDEMPWRIRYFDVVSPVLTPPTKTEKK